jgi:hypothetical protein
VEKTPQTKKKARNTQPNPEPRERIHPNRPSNNLALWRDLPLEVRIKDAYSPLYLKRYE